MLLLLGGLGLVGRLERLFTDRVVGVVLILISTTLLPILYPMLIGKSEAAPHGDPFILMISTLIMLAIILLSHWTKGYTRNLSVFLGITLGFAAMFVQIGRAHV